MQKRRVGTSDLQVSEISFGTMSIGTDEQQGIRLLHEAHVRYQLLRHSRLI